MIVKNRETGETFEAWKVGRIGILDLGLVPNFVQEMFKNDELDFKNNGSIIVKLDDKVNSLPAGNVLLEDNKHKIYAVTKNYFAKTYEVVE
jgi:hypothetical protein